MPLYSVLFCINGQWLCAASGVDRKRALQLAEQLERDGHQVEISLV